MMVAMPNDSVGVGGQVCGKNTVLLDGNPAQANQPMCVQAGNEEQGWNGGWFMWLRPPRKCGTNAGGGAYPLTLTENFLFFALFDIHRSIGHLLGLSPMFANLVCLPKRRSDHHGGRRLELSPVDAFSGVCHSLVAEWHELGGAAQCLGGAEDNLTHTYLFVKVRDQATEKLLLRLWTLWRSKSYDTIPWVGVSLRHRGKWSCGCHECVHCQTFNETQKLC